MSNATTDLMTRGHEIRCFKSGIETAMNRLHFVERKIAEELSKTDLPDKDYVLLHEIQDNVDDVMRFLDHLKT